MRSGQIGWQVGRRLECRREIGKLTIECRLTSI